MTTSTSVSVKDLFDERIRETLAQMIADRVHSVDGIHLDVVDSDDLGGIHVVLTDTHDALHVILTVTHDWVEEGAA